ncbi:MAG TPA: hypothetical protein VHP37_30855 [Burkholderiales bacterium]|nr:hypothetical protein [Burkholderiales bacterium]
MRMLIETWEVVSRRMAIAVVVAVLAGCSSISIDAAKALATTGGDTAAAAEKSSRASDDEFGRSMMAEAFLHGTAKAVESPAYTSLLSLYESIQRELSARAAVLQRLAGVYGAFADLASFDNSAETQKALNELGGAINGYASAVKASPPLSDAAIGVISTVGGLIAAEAQKRKLAEASREIRGRVAAFHTLLSAPLVKEQQAGFQSMLLADRKAALVLLWRAGVYEPSAIINDLGKDVGLTARDDAAAVVTTRADSMAGLEAVVDWQIRRRHQQIERGYSTSVASLQRLVAEHEKFEQGQPMDLSQLRAHVEQLRKLAEQIAK